eukprot:TRINITY_DN36679_c0_g1_i1.p1 TRINITY_DN36679_c0_g1~~TRINITY_DN36679_c0_g1_i1.p1  ORF type:complete len:487 (-),score=125.59 TRINITY_DN36679_c0_g1_i1:269-1729(-)
MQVSELDQARMQAAILNGGAAGAGGVGQGAAMPGAGVYSAGFGGMPGGVDMNPISNPMLMAQLMQLYQQPTAVSALQAQMAGGMPGMPSMAMPQMPMMPMASYASPGVVASAEPVVQVSVEGMKFQYQLTEDDIHKVFRRYGTVKRVSVNEAASSAMVVFDKTSDAQAAMNDLDNKVLTGLDGTLRITWVSQPPPTASPYASMPFATAGLLQGGQASHLANWQPSGHAIQAAASNAMVGGEDNSQFGKNSAKYTGRFLIGIENDKDFQVARKLIGPKGSNVKRIWQATSAKLRLRGVGSGYLEGAGQKESSEPLQLCISCTTQEGYDMAKAQVEALLKGIYEEYRHHCRQKGMPAPDLQINLSESRLTNKPPGPMMGAGAPMMPASNGKGSGAAAGLRKDNKRDKKGAGKRSGQRVGDGDRGTPGPDAPSVEEIENLINERNQARKSHNFEEADRIRQLLETQGVKLMDEPGGRGKGADVTTWQYI